MIDAGAPGPLLAVLVAAVGVAATFRGPVELRTQGLVASTGAGAAVLAGDVRWLAAAWIGLSVHASARAGEGDVPSAWGALGDGVALAGLAAASVDRGAASLPWAAAESQTWVVGLVVAGLVIRSVAAGTTAPELVAFHLAVLARLVASGAEVPAAVVMVAPVGLALAWWGWPTVGAGLVATSGAAAGAAVTGPIGAPLLPMAVAALLAVAGSVPRVASPLVLRRAEIGARLRGGPAGVRPGGRAPAVLLALAVVLLVQGVPLSRHPEASVPLLSGLALFVIASAGSSIAVPPRAALMAAVASLAVAAAVLVAPGVWSDLTGGPDGVGVVLDRARSGTLGALAFGAVIAVAPSVLGARRRGRAADQVEPSASSSG